MTSNNTSMVKTLIYKVVLMLLFVYAIGILVVHDKSAYTQGILFGGLFTILKIVLMDLTIKRALKKPPEKAKAYVQANYMLRYLLSFIVLFVGIVTPIIDGIAVVIAMLTLKIAAYIQGLMEPKTPLDGSVEFVEWEDDEEPSDF